MAAISVSGLTFRYPRNPRVVLDDLSFELAAGSRCLLLGANGAGKSTLLNILGGRHMVAQERVRVLGRAAFHDTSLADRVQLLAGPFPLDVDVGVGEMLGRAQRHDPARARRILEILDIDPAWRMHQVSDGQRRRVQLLLGLLRPAEVLLLDEVTTDLDVIARADLLAFLHAEPGTILYATHIFDGLEAWSSHLLHLRGGRLAWLGSPAEHPDVAAVGLYRAVVGWLRAERTGPR